ncbi:MAG: putative zinc-binding metallopeptidase [Ilumatobacter fluminis]|uniref:zinc-binding metallopeptidase family protein n=1 Tax=Ilumatobacter fluminis TaxID=467091 RepID=UPI0032EF9999
MGILGMSRLAWAGRPRVLSPRAGSTPRTEPTGSRSVHESPPIPFSTRLPPTGTGWIEIRTPTSRSAGEHDDHGSGCALMRLFHCDRCEAVLAFDAHECASCRATVGYVPGDRRPCVLQASTDPSVFHLDAPGDRSERPMWRCLNAAWGCNWMLPVDSGETWCRSCRLTRGRPDTGRPDAIAAWATVETAKRRLIHQLDEFALPIEIDSASMPDGLVFDLVYLPGEGGITGHLDGLVTLDLAEADDGHRDGLRRRLGEQFRTVIGHLRHEIGHYYWLRLVGQSNDIGVFRRLFGDERDDYRAAVDAYYAGASSTWDRARFVTGYASSHPLEDWAETFAHYLHIVDAVDTAAAHDLVPADRAGMLVTEAVATLPFADILDAWRPISAAVNAIAETVGAPAVYPFEPAGVVVDKLTFVHDQVAAHTRRDRFYANE